jgi:hypothetical protein
MLETALHEIQECFYPLSCERERELLLQAKYW